MNLYDKEKIGRIFDKVIQELDKATLSNGSFNSAHEGYAVILEELDELWDQVKLKEKDRNYNNMKKECVQIAAMAIRFIVDCC